VKAKASGGISVGRGVEVTVAVGGIESVALAVGRAGVKVGGIEVGVAVGGAAWQEPRASPSEARRAHGVGDRRG
jgi:hypothetical protein